MFKERCPFQHGWLQRALAPQNIAPQPRSEMSALMTQHLPNLTSDLLLLHAPAFFDFRNRRDIYFPYLSTSGDVPITPLYEYFPLGWKTLQRFLSERDHSVRILNLSSLLLRYPSLSADAVFTAIDVKLLGIDLHWMVHVQGSLEVARRFKGVHPEVPIIFGGISSTYYAHELIRYPFVDMVMRGYNTHEPMNELLGRIKRGEPRAGISNLLWKDERGQVVDNGFDHKPPGYGCGIDWSTIPSYTPAGTLPILEVLSTQNAGCAFHCGWCGGSNQAFRRVFGTSESVVCKSEEDIALEFSSMRQVPNLDRYHFYAVGSYNETPERLDHFLDQVAAVGLKSVSYEQHGLASDAVLRRMAAANTRTSITLSPESSSPRIGRLAGRGNYTMAEMEAWIDHALSLGIHNIDVWFFIGMPEQDESAVKAEVDFCAHLLDRFSGRRVTPLLCPMMPFLDPASTFFENPEEYGYRVFYRTVEEHRNGMQRASVINRINYETRWLSRADLVHVGYRAVAEVMQLRAKTRQLPTNVANAVSRSVTDALEFIDVVHEADCLGNPVDRTRAMEKLGDGIVERNQAIFSSEVANQAFPINRQIGGRWFDEMGWTPSQLDCVVQASKS
jgi:clorobiocin biosynthesis protein CloN6